jgi:hypothetical protein
VKEGEHLVGFGYLAHNIKVNVKQIGCEVAIHLARDRVHLMAIVNTVLDTLALYNAVNFLTGEYWLLKRKSTLVLTYFSVRHMEVVIELVAGLPGVTVWPVELGLVQISLI